MATTGENAHYRVIQFLRDPEATHINFTRAELKMFLQQIPSWLQEVEREMRETAWESPNAEACDCWACRCIRGGRRVDMWH